MNRNLLFIRFVRKEICLGIALLIAAATLSSAQTRTLRVVTYNIEDDINGATSPLPGLIAPPANSTNVQAGGVLEGIGEETVGGDPAQPIDILALQETTSNPQTVAPIVSGLNAFYGIAGMYSNSSYQAVEEEDYLAEGNGPNAIVFNTQTLQLLASVPVDPVGGTNALGASSGEYREVMRYEFAPAGVAVTASNVFYVYVSHYKSGTDGTDLTDRYGEALIIRTNEARDLPANARVLYTGDYNVTTSGEASYQTILSNTAPTGVAQGGGIDPLNFTNNRNINWGTSTSATNILAMETESATDLRYRDDFEIMTTNIYYGAPGGLQYVPGTYHTFGNNGTTTYQGSVDSATNTALNNSLVTNGPVFISAAQLYLDLTEASDHLPLVADYAIPVAAPAVPAPVFSSITLAGNNLVMTVNDAISNATCTLLMCTNLTSLSPVWIAVATNTATGATFPLILTNAAGSSAPQAFFMPRGTMRRFVKDQLQFVNNGFAAAQNPLQTLAITAAPLSGGKTDAF